MKIKELMCRNLFVVYGGDTVQKVAEEMKKTNHGLACVYDNIENRNVIGVISNKDIINRVIALNKSPKLENVSTVMTKKVICLKPNDTTSTAIMRMIKHNVKRILVIEGGILQGVISSNDIIKGMIKYKKDLLDLAIDF